MKCILISIAIFTCLFTNAMEQPRPSACVQLTLNNYQNERWGYVQPLQAQAMIKLLNNVPALNDLSRIQKQELQDAAGTLNKQFLKDLAQTITLQSTCGALFAIPRDVAKESGLLNPIMAAFNNEDIIQVPLEIRKLKLFFKACWFKYYTNTLFWMKNCQELDECSSDDILQTADFFLADFVKETINDTNMR